MFESTAQDKEGMVVGMDAENVILKLYAIYSLCILVIIHHFCLHLTLGPVVDL